MPDPEIITPQNNFFLLGQEEAERVILEAYNSNKLHNSWIIAGEKGIGKATLAYKFARFLLDDNRHVSSLNTSPDSSSNRLISSGSHPDLKIIERDYIETDRKKIIKSIKDGTVMSDSELQNMRKSAFIKIDDVRGINDFMAKKSSQNGWKVVIIDSIDDMNNAAANALLKILEEPPAQSLMMLISHNPERLLPTIRSRCSKLMLKPLGETDVVSLLRRYRPQLEEAEIKGIAAISSGSIGKALLYADGGALNIYQELQDIIFAGSKFKLHKALEWIDAAVGDDERYVLCCELILKFCSDNVASFRNIAEVVEIWEYAVKSFRQAEGLNLDKKQVLLNIINKLCQID